MRKCSDKLEELDSTTFQLDGKVSQVQNRRRALQLGSLGLVSLTSYNNNAANAYDKTYPGELDYSKDGIIDTRQRKRDSIAAKESNKLRSDPIASSSIGKPLGALLWGGALWFLLGSRSNPLVTPLANVLYDEKQENWLKDRNEGLFANLPLPLFGLLATVFALLGFATDFIITFAAEQDHSTSLQWAGVTLIAGGALELGRIASGEKKQTRQESDRDAVLEREFEQFATSRLKAGGNCHRNEVVRTFRRFYAKYRQPDNPDHPLADSEIEQLLRNWSRPLRGVEMSEAGFYKGLQINQDADVFTTR